jgi:hypothetical protein
MARLLNFTSYHTGTRIFVVSDKVAAIAEAYPANAKPEIKPLYTEIWIGGTKMPLQVTDGLVTVAQIVQDALDEV